MVRIDSLWIKAPVTLLLVIVAVTLYVTTPDESERAIVSLAMILLIEGYVLGIDSTIMKRILQMEPLNRILNGLYYSVLGIAYLVIMIISGGFVFVQFGFMLFVCLVGFSILVYHLRKAEPIRGKRFKLGFVLSTLLVAIGSDVGVTALFFSVFVIIDYTTGILLFILGYIIRAVGGFIGNRAGVIKQELFVGEEPSSK
jgi:uncharacterized membrane protein